MAPTDSIIAIPALLKIASSGFLLVIAVSYWRSYGPSNFLWLSDIGLACTVLAIDCESPLLASMAAIGVLPLELAWSVDFLSGGRALGLAAYMFDPSLPRYLRGLSLFHLAVPPVLIVLLCLYGYDRHAFIWQLPLTWIVLVLSYWLTQPEKNINWVFGPGRQPQQSMSPLMYFAIAMAAMSTLLLAMHLILQGIFPPIP